MQLVTGRQRVMHARFFTTDELELLRHQNHIAAAEHRQQQMTETDSQVRARHVRVFSLAQGVCMSFLGLFVGRLLLTYMHSHSQQTQDSFRQAFQIRSEQHAATAQSLMLELESSLRLEEKPSGGFTERGYSIKQLHLGFELIKEIFEMNEILLPKKALWDFNKSEITSATMIDAIMFPMLAFATLSLINYFVLKLSRGT